METEEPAPRFVVAQSWWIASELVRRNPALQLIETHPGGGQYDCLSLFTDTRDPQKIVDLNRAGGIHVFLPGGQFDETAKPITWPGVMHAQGAHDIVKRIETAARLHVPKPTPATGAAAISYRVIARVLATLVNDRDPWDVRNEYHDTSGDGGGRQGFVDGFATARDAVREGRPTDLHGVAEYRFWALLRAGETIAILDTDGRVHTEDGAEDLLPLYVRHGRELGPTVHAALGRFLP